MAWPQTTDYNAAIQNPQICFTDADLCQGQAVGDLFGLPRPHAGNFADVYQILTPSGPSWAVKCFTREVPGLRERYQAVSAHLARKRLPFMIDFRYLEEGICIEGEWFPVLKMRWVEGFTLNDFVRQHLDRTALLERLSQMWLLLARELRKGEVGHGDLQHGNVLLVPGKGASLGLRLIDYDGLCVPDLASIPSREVGHPSYQHPQRLTGGYYGPETDRFSHLVLYTALRALAVDPRLWERHDNGENLLFRQEDFRMPSRSPLFRELWGGSDGEVRCLAGRLLLAAQGPVEEVPLLDEFVDNQRVRPLAAEEEALVCDLLEHSDEGVSEPLRSAIAVSSPSPASVVTSMLPEYLRTANPESIEAIYERAAAAEPLLQTTVSAPFGRRQPAEVVKGSGRERRGVRFPQSAALAAAGVIAVCILPVLAWRVWVPGTRDRETEEPQILDRKAVETPAQVAVVSRPVPRWRDDVRVELTPSQPFFLDILVDRHGYQGELTLDVEDLPPQFFSQRCSATKGYSSMRLELQAAFNAPPRDLGIKNLCLWAGKEKVWRGHVRISVDKQLPVLQVTGPLLVGRYESVKVRVRVDRRESSGTLEITMRGLPQGVTCDPVLLPAGLTEADLTLEVAPTAPEREYVIRVVALNPDGKEVAVRQVTLNVPKQNPEAIPAAYRAQIVTLEEKWRVRPEQFEWGLHNELRHLYLFVDMKLSFYHSNIILKNSPMDGYILMTLGASEKQEKAIEWLQVNGKRYAEFSYVSAACWLKLAELEKDDKEKSKKFLEKVIALQGGAMGRYRDLAKAKLADLDNAAKKWP